MIADTGSCSLFLSGMRKERETMNDQDSAFNFKEVDDGLDIDAIFGGSADAPPEPPPFGEESEPVQTVEAPQSSETTGLPAADSASAEAAATTEAATSTEAPAESPECASGEEPDLFSVFSDASPKNTSTSPAKASEPAASEQQLSVFDRPPVFKYGSARDPIKDGSMTFEELRIAKADDFPELSEGKKVTWSVKYGSITKAMLK